MADYVIGWDDELSENDVNEFVLLEEGDYNFKVTNFERGAFKGSAKIPACNKAIITIKIETPKGNATIKTDLIMYSSMEWKISEFFRAIGQKKHGEKLKPNWSAVVGSQGRCHINHREYINQMGENVKTNNVEKFYDYNEAYFNGKIPSAVTDTVVDKSTFKNFDQDEEIPF